MRVRMKISNIMRVHQKIAIFSDGGRGSWSQKKTIYRGELPKRGLDTPMHTMGEGVHLQHPQSTPFCFGYACKRKKHVLKLHTFKFSKCPEISLLSSSRLNRPSSKCLVSGPYLVSSKHKHCKYLHCPISLNLHYFKTYSLTVLSILLITIII